MLQAILALVLVAATQQLPWYEHYEKGVRLIEQGQAAAAKPELEAALAKRAKEGVQLPTSKQQYMDYLPHLYLAIASQMRGDLEAARASLAKAEVSGMPAKSEVGRPLLVAYQLLLRGDATGKLPRPAYAVYAQRDPVLSETEFHTLRNDVLQKCNLPPDTKMNEAPWYANYEIGLELEQKGDYPRALTHFIDAVARRPNPQKQARMYGMWLIDYYPYFHIARSHVRLENWQCAKNALDISQKLGEIPVGAPELDEWVSLWRETEKRVAVK
jgi:tetratricopeptide (TPR) repeat protein